MPLKVLTYNLAHGAPYLVPMPFLRPPSRLRRTLDGIAALLAREAADVVALQEVDRACLFSGGVDQVARIADRAGYAHVLHGAHGKVPGLFEQGAALLSRLPLHAPESHPLGTVDKGFVVASVHWEGLVIDVVSVHLDPFSAKGRQRQVRRMVEALERRPARLRVVMGDLNSHERHPEGLVAQLCGAARLQAHALEGGEPTYTSARPAQRLDWILASPALRFTRYTRVLSRLSDHLPVVAELEAAQPSSAKS
jgi:endonuclease/exonuclease/phosphatase family metal-dependent hydrolase